MVDPQDPNQEEKESQEFPDFSGQQETAEGRRQAAQTPSVASTPGKALVLVLAVVGLVGFILWSILSEDTIPPEEMPKPAPIDVPREVNPPVLPPDPPAPLPNLPVPPPPAPPSTQPQTGQNIPLTFQPPSIEEMLARRKAKSVVMQGKGSNFGTGKPNTPSTKPDLNDPNAAFMASIERNTEAETSEATFLGNLDRLIAQGKMIDAVLETAINTDLPGTLRAIVSHDVFAEHGEHVMIPKGSRLIGTYNTGILRGQRRVFIVWTRLIRPDGVDIRIMSEGTDPLGRAGVEGFVDNKYFEIFSNATLISSVTFAVAGVVQAVNGGSKDSSISRRSYSDGSIDTTGSPMAIASQEFMYTLGGTARDLIGQLIDIRPTITIDQGTLIKVFVNRDLIFPAAASGQPFIVP